MKTSATILRAAFLLACVAPVIASVACGGGEPTPASPPAPTDTSSASAMPSASSAPTTSASTAMSAAPSASASAAPVAWKDMDHGAKLDFMKHTVLPKMKDEFA